MPPKGLCAELDRLIRHFLWGGNKDHNRIHLVNWATMCKDKLVGGLGLKPSLLVNQAYFIKLGWRMISNPDSL